VALVACAGNGDTGPTSAVALKEADAHSTAPGQATPVIVKTLVSDLREPWGEKAGTLSSFSPQDWQRQQITNVPVSAEAGQGGLMDVLVHPDFADNGWLYLSYTIELDGLYTTRVSRLRLAGYELVDQVDLFTARPYFEQRRHFGSRNPFVDKPGARPEIWTYGHRNPQGIARHPHNGAIWIAEHGPQGGDEVNVLSAGNNYGWPLITYGEEYGGGKIGQGTHGSGLQQPLVYWQPSIGAGNIAFYTGDHYTDWQDSLLVAGLRLTRISRLELDGEGLGRETRLLADLKLRIRDVQVGPDGLVYALAGGSRLIRLQ
jgi:glucose/arabinose dehydrogenase